MERVGKEINAADRWRDAATNYVAEIDSAYHAHRLSVIRALLPPLSGKTVLDFGCGEGVLMIEALSHGAAEVFGLDIEETMVDRARQRAPAATIAQGGVSHLDEFGPVDCIIAANVLAYMTDSEEAAFYRKAAETIRPGGYLVVTHSNALFDLATFNAHTVDFCRRELGFDPSPLLRHAELDRASFNIRENPLSYRFKLARHGFAEERQEFINFHAAPRRLTGNDPDDMSRERRDTLDWPEAERWKLMFQCSMFGSRSRRL